MLLICVHSEKVLHSKGFCGVTCLHQSVHIQSIYQINSNYKPRTEQTSGRHVMNNVLSNRIGVACCY